jgi:vacuolar-type H+-ATPase subunit H
LPIEKKRGGPVTPEGKKKVSKNRLCHGLLSEAVVVDTRYTLLGYETQENYDRLLADLVSHLKPVGPIEEMLVDRIASCYWRLRRAVMAESALIAGELDGEVRKLEKADSFNERARRYKHLLEESGRMDYLIERVEERGRLSRDEAREAKKLFPGVPAEELMTRYLEHLKSNKVFFEKEAERISNQVEAKASVPDFNDFTDKLYKYETMLERQIYRALDQLERLQRQRLGDNVPPPVKVRLEKDEV